MAGSTLKVAKQKGVLEAALRVMTRQGVESFSMDDVAEEAGVSKGTLYNYFSNKDELVHATIEHATYPLEEEIEQLFKYDLTPLQKIQFYFSRILSYFDNNEELFRVLLFLRESAQFEKYQKYQSEKHQIYIQKVADVLEDGMDLGQIKRLDPVKTAAIILECTISIISQRTQMADLSPIEEDVQLISEIILRGITKEGAAL